MRHVIPSDALCLIGLTPYDLYEANPDLFVAGMAAGNERVAIFSLFRYKPDLTFSEEFWYFFSLFLLCEFTKQILHLQRKLL